MVERCSAGRTWQRLLSGAQRPISTGSCGGVSVIWLNGSGKSFVFDERTDVEPGGARTGLRKLAARSKHHGKTRKPLRSLKKLPRRSGRDCTRSGTRKTNRNLVQGRGPDRSKEQDHPPLCKTGIKTVRAARPTNAIRLHLRGDLPQAWQGGGTGHALV